MDIYTKLPAAPVVTSEKQPDNVQLQVETPEDDAETIKHNLARSNPEINIRNLTVHKSCAKENGLPLCF